MKDWGNPRVVMGVLLALFVLGFFSLVFTLRKGNSIKSRIGNAVIENVVLLAMVGLVYSFEGIRFGFGQILWVLGSIVVMLAASVGMIFVDMRIKHTNTFWPFYGMVAIWIASFLPALLVGFPQG